jgi:hypothetical protein
MPGSPTSTTASTGRWSQHQLEGATGRGEQRPEPGVAEVEVEEVGDASVVLDHHHDLLGGAHRHLTLERSAGGVRLGQLLLAVGDLGLAVGHLPDPVGDPLDRLGVAALPGCRLGLVQQRSRSPTRVR